MRKKVVAPALAIIALALTGCQGIETPQMPDLPSITLTTPSAEPQQGADDTTSGQESTPDPTPTATSTEGVAPSSPQGTGERIAGTPEQDLIDAAKVALPTLPTVGDDYPSVEGYERSCSDGKGCVFGPAWADNRNSQMERTGCDTRNNVLTETLDPASIEYRDGSNCVVASGTYVEPYFGTVETFVRGEDHSEQDEVDHVIPLRLAWDLGAHEWPMDKRVAFANDAEYNLVLTTRAANAGGLDLDGDGYYDRQDLGEYAGKSDMGASEWLEWMTDDARACNFGARFVLTAERYDLPLTESDARDIAAAFERCA